MIALPSQAGIVDMFNGVTVGDPLPKNNIVFLSAPPPTTNNVQLIDFWATTCAPCRTSIPKLNALHHKYSPKGLVVIGVSEEPREAVVPFLEKVPMHYSSAVEGTASLHKALRIRALPYAIFVNRSGTIVWRGQPSEITGELIESLLTP
ncbi:redoxin family protein [Undibacterium sp. B2R-29]|nr:redoxin family protein [Undibacterium crateris]